MTEAANDFGWTAKLLRSGDERIVRATLSNNLNVILAALDRAAAAPNLFDALKAIVDQLDSEEMGEPGLGAKDWINHWQKLHDNADAALSEAEKWEKIA